MEASKKYREPVCDPFSQRLLTNESKIYVVGGGKGMAQSKGITVKR